MYQLSYFTEHDRKNVLDFLEAHPFATLIGCDEQESVATQIPVLIKDDGKELIIRGHIMRDTDHYRAIERNSKVLLLFTGANCYVSSSWYSERGHGSTWNYMTVQARGTIQFSDEKGTIQLLSDLTSKHESGEANPVLLENMTDQYVQTLVKHIAGFEIRITALYPIFKLSQNRDDKSYITIIEHLETKDDPGSKEIALQMKLRRKELFHSR